MNTTISQFGMNAVDILKNNLKPFAFMFVETKLTVFFISLMVNNSVKESPQLEFVNDRL